MTPGARPLAARTEAGGKKVKIKIAQIGTGHAHASGKMAAMRRSREFEVVGVAEPDPRRKAALKRDEVYRGVGVMSVEELLGVEGLRAVAVETEVCDLLTYAERCIAAGKHVHLDKPAGESLGRFRKVLRAAGRKKLVVQMGYMFRYNPAFQFAFRAVERGWLGEVFGVHAVIGKTLPARNRSALVKYPGGSMFELGCHVIDPVVRVLGRPTRVAAFPRHAGRHADGLLDNMLAVFEYAKATATVRSALMEVEGWQRRQFVICGDRGTVEIRPLEPPRLMLSLARRRGRFCKGLQEVALPAYVRYDGDFADLAKVIRGEKAHDYPPAHDLAVQEALLAASCRTEKGEESCRC